ncbi:acetoin utilization protein AcuC [Williamsia sp. D3]|uniref:acetoin utilization protein AcuC n=1 Tax=Williamsia sp. D3 TaxID=1313067 RepID=UPI0003D30A11|nr:acetoin utilization protein AcuC [Williamsia sp. D3]ETD32053.1 acetoin utilization protein AcuC [Williamsia sp. D3]
MNNAVDRPGAEPAAVIWSDDFLGYRWTAAHPMNPVRLALTMSLSRSLGVLDGVETTPPMNVDDRLLQTVHTSAYLDAVRSASAVDDYVGGATHLLERLFGLGSTDNPIFEGMHSAASVLVGGTMAAAAAIASGSVRRAVNIGGGMHHAMPGHAAGFCIYNDCAVAIRWLLEQGYDRIAYIDIDAHHGDGVQKVFAADPRVLTVSLHQHPATLWPGSGWPEEVGEQDGRGTAVNIALMPETTDKLWLRAFHAIVPGMLESFRPQIIVSQCGVDSHRRDPLTDLSLTIDGQRAAVLAMRDLADTYAEGRWLAVGGGGYGIVDVVPRSWTHLIAAVTGHDLDPVTTIDESWCRAATEEAQSLDETLRGDPVNSMSDGGDIDYLPWDGDGGGPLMAGVTDAAQTRTDATIMATRRAVYPLCGLDPEDPRD